ncbi:hypothetical protein PR048_022068 [Dryococelus australis]|uniref:Uncharacterized protein n=1 Tax=Dryococelus australis TaxID=614101 RepID=A0ABQ9H069_9NEOP|nr:hypothetical protein PR048_022068 [Dryococelus australis]
MWASNNFSEFEKKLRTTEMGFLQAQIKSCDPTFCNPLNYGRVTYECRLTQPFTPPLRQGQSPHERKKERLARYLYLVCERGRGGLVVRVLTSHLGEPGAITGGVAPGFSLVGIVPNYVAGRRVFPGISIPPPPPPPHCGAAPYSPPLHHFGSLRSPHSCEASTRYAVSHLYPVAPTSSPIRDKILLVPNQDPELILVPISRLHVAMEPTFIDRVTAWFFCPSLDTRGNRRGHAEKEMVSISRAPCGRESRGGSVGECSLKHSSLNGAKPRGTAGAIQTNQITLLSGNALLNIADAAYLSAAVSTELNNPSPFVQRQWTHPTRFGLLGTSFSFGFHYAFACTHSKKNPGISLEPNGNVNICHEFTITDTRSRALYLILDVEECGLGHKASTTQQILRHKQGVISGSTMSTWPGSPGFHYSHDERDGAGTGYTINDLLAPAIILCNALGVAFTLPRSRLNIPFVTNGTLRGLCSYASKVKKRGSDTGDTNTHAWRLIAVHAQDMQCFRRNAELCKLDLLPRGRSGQSVRLPPSSITGAGRSRIFRPWKSCRTMPLIGGFSRGYPVSSALACRRCSIRFSRRRRCESPKSLLPPSTH